MPYSVPVAEHDSGACGYVGVSEQRLGSRPGSDESAARSSSPRPSPQPSGPGAAIQTHVRSLTRSDQSIGSDPNTCFPSACQARSRECGGPHDFSSNLSLEIAIVGYFSSAVRHRPAVLAAGIGGRHRGRRTAPGRRLSVGGQVRVTAKRAVAGLIFRMPFRGRAGAAASL